MQNNVLPLSNINRPQVLSSLNKGFQYNSSAINKNIYNYIPKIFSLTGFQKPLQSSPTKMQAKKNS